MYTIDKLTPDYGFTRDTMVEDGDYELEQVAKFRSLKKAIFALERFRIDDDTCDYDLKDEGGVILTTISGVLTID